MKMNINNTIITASGVTSQSTADEIANAIKKDNTSKNFRSNVTKKVFIDILKRANMEGEKAEEIATKLGDNFFKTEPPTTPAPTAP